MGFLGTEASLFADMALIIQAVGFIILISGGIHVKKGNLPIHFKLTRTAVLLGVIAFIWMGYSFIKLILLNLDLLTVSHAIFGILALSTGILFAFDRLIIKTKTSMRIVFLLWTIALFLGIMFYIKYYMPGFLF